MMLRYARCLTRPMLQSPRRIGLEDAADHGAIGKHIKIVVFPLAGRARSGRAFEDQTGHIVSRHLSDGL
jgi:hypothetical protein